jgi:hypothetical protein
MHGIHGIKIKKILPNATLKLIASQMFLVASGVQGEFCRFWIVM